MKKCLVITFLPSLICFSIGCTSYWYQEEKTFEECRQDLQQCRYEMEKYADDVQYSLGAYEIRFEKECMKQKGYRRVIERDLPLRVKRQGPQTSIGEKYGVAGTIEK